MRGTVRSVEPEAELTAESDLTGWGPGDAAHALRVHGCRVTRPRVAVLGALLDHDGPVDAATLTLAAQGREPGIHEATVYRTIATLAEAGMVSHLHAGHGPSLVRLAGDRRLVVVCRRCNTLAAAPRGAVLALVESTELATGIRVDPGHFAIEGLCAACRADAG